MASTSRRVQENESAIRKSGFRFFVRSRSKILKWHMILLGKPLHALADHAQRIINLKN